jgi:DNA-binding PadR family transcriptional regulator
MLAVSILGLLMSDPLHGYEIRKQLGELLGFTGAISYGSLYPTLAKLHRQGLIETAFDDGHVIVRPKKEKAVFSTGSLTGDIALDNKSPFTQSAIRSPRKKKKVYSITTKGREAFAEKLNASFTKNADDDRAFVAHLAFMNHLLDADKEIFINNRIDALSTRLARVPVSDNHELKLWHDVEREYIHQQISFLVSLRDENNLSVKGEK